MVKELRVTELDNVFWVGHLVTGKTNGLMSNVIWTQRKKYKGSYPFLKTVLIQWPHLQEI